jgi:hypothetical protein
VASRPAGLVSSGVSPSPGPPSTVIRTGAPGACFLAFVSPSRTIRYAVSPAMPVGPPSEPTRPYALSTR